MSRRLLWGSVAPVAFLLCLFSTNRAYAYPFYHPSCPMSMCPAGIQPPTTPGNCAFCHVHATSGGSGCTNPPCFNPLGRDYFNAGGGWADIDDPGDDADGDNISNEQERTDGTLPGFPNGATQGGCNMQTCALDTTLPNQCSNGIDCSYVVRTSNGNAWYDFSFMCRTSQGYGGSLGLTDTSWSTDCSDVNGCAGFPGSHPCVGNPGACTDTPAGSGYTAPGYDCSNCGAGYTDVNANPDQCRLDNPCLAGLHDCVQGSGACVDGPGSGSGFSCTCSPAAAYTGDGRSPSLPPAGGTGCNNINECTGSPCMQNGNHDDNGGQDGQGCSEMMINGSWLSPGYTCSCEMGYSQGGSPRHCTIADECAGTVDCDTMPMAMCDDPTPDPGSLGDYDCNCPSGYVNHPMNDGHGDDGCVDIDECMLGIDTCDANATCLNTIGGYTCTCNAPAWEDMGGTAGRVCIDVNECMRNIDNCDTNATCMNTTGSFNCTCNAPAWEDAPGTSGGVSCVDVDECMRNIDDCDTNATCTNSTGSFACECNAPAWEDAGGTDGRSCVDVDECSILAFSSLCSSVARCENSIGSWACICNDGFRGDGFDCENIDECMEGTDTCDVNATCTDSIGSYSCACNSGYLGSGFACADIDECAAGTHGCQVNEDCVNNIGAPNDCVCAPGYLRNATTGTCEVTCGDGVVGAGEECDDGNLAVMDGCSDACTIEPGWACVEPTGAASVCTETCGDGLVDATEECDDGTANNSDTTPDACRETCRLPSCGDGTTDSGEECDDGSSNSDTGTDRCRVTCNLPYCGDGVVDTGEVCDLGGGVPGAAAVGQCTTACFPDAGIDPSDPPVLTGGACSCRAGTRRPPVGGTLLVLALLGLAWTRRRT